MGWLLALRTEVFHRLHYPVPKYICPETVHCDSRGQRIGGSTSHFASDRRFGVAFFGKAEGRRYRRLYLVPYVAIIASAST